MDNRCLKSSCQFDDGVVGARGACASQDGDLLGSIQRGRDVAQLGVGGADDPVDGADRGATPTVMLFLEEVLTGDHEHGNTASFDGGADRDVQQAGQLCWGADHFAEVAALDEQLLGVRLLEVSAADLRGRYVRSDREHRHATALRVEETVDQVQIARPAASDAHRELAGECRLRRGGECGTFLVARVDPLDPLILA